MRKNYGRLLLLLAALVMGSSPAALAQATPGDTAALEGATWVLQSYGDAGNPTAVLAGTEITAVVNGRVTPDGTTGSISGSAGCNQYFASYKADGGTLAISSVGATRRFCAELAGVMQQEQQYLALLVSVTRYRVLEGRLELTTADGRRLLRYTARQ